ncbi:MAG: hypothetical protein JO264_17740 [Acidisphaera sp.]|nr:hypothetical protein [Acidisphaera sp.]
MARIVGLGLTLLGLLAASGCAGSSAPAGYQALPTAVVGTAMTADPERAGVGSTINPATGISESGGE